MCGIVGHVAMPQGHADIGAVRAAMVDIAHRGPDGAGLADLGQACLGHRRLSIIDVAGSPQPWQSPDGRYTIVFNGEIYNYVELRQQLRRHGIDFRSNGDTEVLLAAYVAFGYDCLRHLNGMYAFAVWDDHEKTLFAARDRVGKKPFFYAHTNHGFCFSSEIQAIRRFKGVNRELDAIAVHDFFAHQCIGRDRTICQGIRKLKAGHWLKYAAGEVVTQAYWKAPVSRDDGRSVDDLAEELRALFEDAVRLRLRSDVPVGAFLSGGLDSAIVVAAMKRAGADVQSFTIGFNDSTYNEAREAAETAAFLGTRHSVELVELSIRNAVVESLVAFGEPFADPSAVPTGALCQHARERVIVALSGDGVDELFGGYRRYLAAGKTAWLRALPAPIRLWLARFILNAIPDSSAYFGSSRSKQLRLIAQLVRNGAEAPNDPLAQLFAPSERADLLQVAGNKSHDFDYLRELGLEGLSSVAQMMLADVQTYLVDDILVKVDRMSMRHGLEVRCPFLDHRIVEFACRLPVRWRIQGSAQKFIVRRAFSDWLPPVVMKRPKHGFSVPLAQWFRGPLRSLFESAVLTDHRTTQYLSLPVVESMWREHQSGYRDNGLKLWSMLAFCAWLEHAN